MRAIAVIAVAASLMAGAASAQSAIRVGQTVNGELTTSDARLDDGSFYDCYTAKPQGGQRIQVDQISNAFDSYLSVVSGSCTNPGEMLANNDDGGGGLNSRITLDADGREWAIVTNSIEGGATGAYQLRLTAVSGGAPASTGGSSSGGGRPSGGQDRYEWDVLCKAADTVAMVAEMENLSDTQLTAWLTDSDRLRQAAFASGRALGHSEDEVTNQVGAYGAAMINDMEIAPQAGQIRATCLAAL